MSVARINGFSMHYEDLGRGPALVFQHAWLSSSIVWGGVVPALQDRYRCITLDTRGAGDSERIEEGHDSAQYAQDLLALADHLGVERFTVIGHSSGGFVANEVALAAPGRVNGQVLVGSFVDIDFLPAEMTSGMLGLAELVASRDAAAEGMLQGFFNSILARATPELVAGAAQLALSESPGFLRGAIQSVVDTHRGSGIEAITTPTLVVSGSADPFLGACVTASQRLPNAALHVFNRVGHIPPAEVPVELAGVIDDFAQYGVVNAATLAASASE